MSNLGDSMEPLGIGDSTRDGLLVITDTHWNNNGTLRVTVAEQVGQRPEYFPVRKARRLARRAIMYPDKTRSSKLVNLHYCGGQTHATFAVSRLD